MITNGRKEVRIPISHFNSFVLGVNSRRNSLFNLRFIFSGESLAYPFIPNAYSAAMISTGLTSIRYALFRPQIFVCISLVVSMYSLHFYFSKKHAVCALSLFLFANLGGLAWCHGLDPKYRSDHDWIHMWKGDQEEYWFHPNSPASQPVVDPTLLLDVVSFADGLRQEK
jgi:hypothetical protein